MTHAASYYSNHDRRTQFPWSLYHAELARRIAQAVHEQGKSPRVLVVGCGLEPFIEGGPQGAIYYGCDLDERAVALCRERFPHMSDRLAVCPSPYELPHQTGFEGGFDVIVAKEVIEHVLEPERWAIELTTRLADQGQLVLTTPNYGRFSTLALLESTVLEWVAQRDGFSRRDIHPTKFDRHRLTALDTGPGMRLLEVKRTLTGWALLGRWRRAA